MRVCPCGNTLEGDEDGRGYRLIEATCRCDKPASRTTRAHYRKMPRHVPAGQYAQRDRLGLPRLTPLEMPGSRWV